ncbi:MAG: hypothetical protein QOE36_412 [Gaiellaceae bacterium]|nr:hypothetical protein [Gaiellaceae bacterium]
MRSIAVLIAAVCLALPAGAAGRTHSGPSFAFGRVGGNIAPFTVEIRADGTVASSGQVRLAHPTLRLSRARLAGLARRARTQRFGALPAVIRCRGSLPDFAMDFVTIRTAAGTQTTKVRGDCSARFARVYASLETAAAVVR